MPKPSLASRLDTQSVPGLPTKPVENEDKPATDDVEMKVEDDEKAVNIGRAVLEDLAKALQEHLDERKWRSARYLVRPIGGDMGYRQLTQQVQIVLFTSLTSLPSTTAPLVSSASLIVLLTSFTAVLSEPGLRAARGDECVRVVVEAMLRMSTTSETDGLREQIGRASCRERVS